MGLLTIGAAITTFLALVASWQHWLDGKTSHAVADELVDARERGTHQAIAQHPQIDALSCIGCGSCVEACPERGVLGLINGIATVIHGSRCIGHGLCAGACPVGAIQVGLGELASSPDIPVLDESLKSSIPGIYIAGELSGMALIRNAVEQGTRAVTAIARSRAPGQRNRHSSAVDVLIVGAGPAGLAATLRAVELGLSYRTIDMSDIGGTIRKYPRRKLTLTQPVDLPLWGSMGRHEYLKEELIDLWETVVADLKLRVDCGIKLQSVNRHQEDLVAQTSAGRILARSMVLALGRRGTPRRLGVPGEEAEHVLYQLMDATDYRHRRILVVGGGDSAIEAAADLASQPGNKVTLSYRKPDFFRLKDRNRALIANLRESGQIDLLMSSQVVEIGAGSVSLTVGEGDQRVGHLVGNDHAFVFAGGEPPFPLLRSMGIRFGGDAEAASGSSQAVSAA